MKHIFGILCVTFLLAACASGPSQYVLDMQKYQGVSEAALIDALGPPDNQYTVGAVKYLTYTKASQYIYPEAGPSFGVGTGSNGSGVWMGQTFGSNRRAAIQNNRCDVFFSIVNRRVDKVGHRGNSC